MKAKVAKQLRALLVDIEDVELDPRNARLHPDRNIESIKRSFRKFGQRKPIVIQKRARGKLRVIAGNGMVMAARLLGWTGIAAVTVEEDDQTAAAFAIADNRAAELAIWDDETLNSLLESLRKDDWDLEDVGFSAQEFEAMFGVGSSVAEDAVPELPKVPVSRPGDLWVVGDSRVLCGDALLAASVESALAGRKADMVFTDPPYNVSYGKLKASQLKGERRKRLPRDIEGDDLPQDEWASFCRGVAETIRACTTGCVYVCHAPGPDGRIMAMALDQALHPSTTIIWAKNAFNFGRAKYHNQYEPIWFGWNGTGKKFTRRRDLANVWKFDRMEASPEHPTMKPVELVANAISHACSPGGVVFDPFLGSGTTLIAAQQLGRRCCGIEIDPRYIDVALERWEKVAKGKARLGRSNGPTLATMRRRRKATSASR